MSLSALPLHNSHGTAMELFVSGCKTRRCAIFLSTSSNSGCQPDIWNLAPGTICGFADAVSQSQDFMIWAWGIPVQAYYSDILTTRPTQQQKDTEKVIWRDCAGHLVGSMKMRGKASPVVDDKEIIDNLCINKGDSVTVRFVKLTRREQHLRRSAHSTGFLG
ncbi:hypothetical protein ARMGADRAFT_1028293 [Armillaria gallica]|uniref:Uncharacterized protein n=1 Tax=Armillaria gallica TaxID=47427 RepID=A0A2H3E8V6_ARMGA|nr:hypothetical protein ARMGADRAFT_1028293 [Armillaria gallica]